MVRWFPEIYHALPITTVPAGMKHPKRTYEPLSRLISYAKYHCRYHLWSPCVAKLKRIESQQQTMIYAADLPSGETGCHLMSSHIVALTKGRWSRSAISGRRVPPVTESISAWQRFWISGNSVMARKNACIDATLYVKGDRASVTRSGMACSRTKTNRISSS